MSSKASHDIGWIGLGRMGEAMAARLVKAGHGLSVWNRTASKADPLAQIGAEVVTDKAAMAHCATVFTMVSTTDDLKEILFAKGGVLAAIGFGLVFGHNLLTPIDFRPGEFGYSLWTILHDRGFLVAEGAVKVKVSYPLLPWIGIIALGFLEIGRAHV